MGRKTYFYPVIEFAAADKTIRVKTNFKAFYPDTFSKGKLLSIQYNPQNPYDMKLRGKSLWEGVIGMGFMFLLGAVIIYISR